jgi:DNA replication and repair protein RecF
LSLSLKLAAHRLVAERVGEPPLLLLDDVFSELDPHRAAALVTHLPEGQALLTTAGTVPDGLAVDRVLCAAGGEVRDAA